MVMTEACQHVASVHDRMPVILKRADWTDWLDGPPDAAGLLCRPYPELMAVERTVDSWGASLERNQNKPLDPTRRGGAVDGMRLGPGKWRVLIQGDETVFELFPCNREGLDYLLLRLFEGKEVAQRALAHYCITVRLLGDDDEVIVISSRPPD